MQILTRHNKVIDYCANGYVYMGSTVICPDKNCSFEDCTIIDVGSVPADIDLYNYYYISGCFIKEELKAMQETFESTHANYAAIATWADSNTAGEDRLGLFVAIDTVADAVVIRKATSADTVWGVVVAAPAFCSNAKETFFNMDGTLKPAYAYVGILGIMPVKDTGTLATGNYCLPDDDGVAVAANAGYQVLNRVDNNYVRIIVDPGASLRIKMPSQAGAANGLATLDANSKVTAEQASAKTVITNTSRTLTLSDAGKRLRVSSSSAVVLTIPLESTVNFPDDTEIEVVRINATGTVTIAGEAGVIISSKDGAKSIANRYGCIMLWKDPCDSNAWILAGDLG